MTMAAFGDTNAATSESVTILGIETYFPRLYVQHSELGKCKMSKTSLIHS